jgi:Tfp pilus assembly protein PilF
VSFVRRWLIALVLVLVAALGYGGYLAVRQQRGQRLRLAYEPALQQRDFAKAHALMVDYLRIFPRDAEVHLLAAQTARRCQFAELFFGPQTDLLQQAAQHLDDCSRLHGPEESINIERALLRVQQGDFAGSEDSLLAYVRTDKADVPLVLEGLIYGYFRRGDLDRAGVYTGELLALEPENVQGLLWRGRLNEQVFANPPAAREDFEQAVHLQPGFLSARFCLVEILIRTNRTEEADQQLVFLEQKIPDNPWVRLSRALCQLGRGQTRAGRALLDDWLKKTPATHPGRLDALKARARASLLLDEPSQAEDYARQVLRISSLDRTAMHTLFRSLIAQGRQQEANEVQVQLERINKDMEFVGEASTRIVESPDDLSLRHRLGAAYLRLGRKSEALVWFQSVLDRDPAYRSTLQALTEYYEHAGDDRKAAEFRQRLAAAGKGS